MTNTLSSIYATTTAGISNACDGWIGIGLVIGLALVGFAIFKKFAPTRTKVV